MRIQHPAATARVDQPVPSQVAVPVGETQYTTVPTDDGFLDVPDDAAERTMARLAAVYDVEYTDDGDVVGAEADSDSDTNSTDEGEPAEGESDSSAEGLGETLDTNTEPLGDEVETESEDDVDTWADWSEDAWFEMGFQDRAEDVREGRVDDHLEEIAEIESSSTVESAVDERQADLETETDTEE